MSLTRRGFLKFQLVAGTSFALAPRHARAERSGLDEGELSTMIAAAEALVPTGKTPGADASWARRFIVGRLRARPVLVTSYRACAVALEAAARANGGSAFAAQPVARREAVIRGLCPSVSLHPAEPVPAAQLELRRPLNEMVVAFFASDHLGIDHVIYQRRSKSSHDPAKPTNAAHSSCYEHPDAFVAAMGATSTGGGDYNRAWAFAGYPSAPGVCKSAAEITTAVRMAPL